MLYVSFRCKNESDILGSALSYKVRYQCCLPQITMNKKNFEFWHAEVDEALSDILNENCAQVDHLSSAVASNLRSMDDSDIETGTKNITTDVDKEAMVLKLRTTYEEFQCLTRSSRNFFLKCCSEKLKG